MWFRSKTIKEYETDIKVMVGLIIFSILGTAIYVQMTGEPHLHYIVDYIVLGLLAFGVYKKSRTAAVIAILYYVISKVLMFVDNAGALQHNVGPAVTSVFFLVIYIRGVIATYKYHKLKQLPVIEKSI